MAKARERGPSGLLVVDKPAGMTSHDVVSKIRWIAGTRRVGHAGTLDPAATGVLVLGLNKATKLLTYLVGQDKTYEARLVLGAATLTEDAEGELTGIARAEAVRGLTREKIEDAVRSLMGDIMQVPSAVSASFAITSFDVTPSSLAISCTRGLAKFSPVLARTRTVRTLMMCVCAH